MSECVFKREKFPRSFSRAWWIGPFVLTRTLYGYILKKSKKKKEMLVGIGIWLLLILHPIENDDMRWKHFIALQWNINAIGRLINTHEEKYIHIYMIIEFSFMEGSHEKKKPIIFSIIFDYRIYFPNRTNFTSWDLETIFHIDIFLTRV